MFTERDINHTIAWRNKAVYMTYSCIMGGFPINSDDRLWNMPGAPFVLSVFKDGQTFNYAVKDEDAQVIIDRIRAQCSDNASRRSYPFYNISNDGPEAITAIYIGNEYYAFEDAALLKSWLEDLKGRCGEPLNDRELYDLTHPAPEPVTGDVTVVSMIEQAIVPPQPPALPVPPPDNCRSELLVGDGSAALTIYCGGERYKYTVPGELLPEINEAARKLLANLVNGYHVDWDPAAWISIREREEEFNVDPEGVLALFKELAGKCSGEAGNPHGPLPERIGYLDTQDCNPNKNNMFPGGMMFMNQALNTDAQAAAPVQTADPSSEAWFCTVCGAQNTGKFCIECGSRKP